MPVESMKFRCQQQSLVKLQRDKDRETCRTIGEHKTKYACTVEADESQISWRSHCRKGMNLVHNFIPMPSSNKVPGTMAAVERQWERREKILAWNLTRVKNKSGVIAEARNEAILFILRH